MEIIVTLYTGGNFVVDNVDESGNDNLDKEGKEDYDYDYAVSYTHLTLPTILRV